MYIFHHLHPPNICRVLLLAAGVLMLSISSPGWTQERQHKIEAAFLYGFFNYITWPGYASPQELEMPVICVYGEDPVAYYLDYVRLKRAGERKLAVRTILADDSAEGCHILFLRRRLPYSKQLVLPPTTLTVIKPDGPLDRGGMIELTEEDGRIVIRINQKAIKHRGFEVSSRLLELVQGTQ